MELGKVFPLHLKRSKKKKKSLSSFMLNFGSAIYLESGVGFSCALNLCKVWVK